MNPSNKKPADRKLTIIRGVAIGCCLVVIVFVGLLVKFRKNYLGPEYQGRRLADWSADLSYAVNQTTEESDGRLKTEKHEAAKNAIHHFGTNAIPLALRLCAVENSTLELKLMSLCDDFNTHQTGLHVDHGIKYASVKWEIGLAIFEVLGSNASPAIPTLIEYLNRDNSAAANNATAALYQIGPTAIPGLLIVLTNQNKTAANLAAFCLGQYGSNAVVSTHSLLQCLEGDDALLRDSAACALARISDDPELVVPTFVRYLQQKPNHPHPDVFMKLRNFGTNATQAVPVLVEIIESKSGVLTSRNALTALESIDPEKGKFYNAQMEADRKANEPHPVFYLP